MKGPLRSTFRMRALPCVFPSFFRPVGLLRVVSFPSTKARFAPSASPHAMAAAPPREAHGRIDRIELCNFKCVDVRKRRTEAMGKGARRRMPRAERQTKLTTNVRVNDGMAGRTVGIM